MTKKKNGLPGYPYRIKTNEVDGMDYGRMTFDEMRNDLQINLTLL
jgi:hypothetical protein